MGPHNIPIKDAPTDLDNKTSRVIRGFNCGEVRNLIGLDYNGEYLVITARQRKLKLCGIGCFFGLSLFLIDLKIF